MALDTQPLSRRRRALMLAVLLAFLAGSLAFAEYLVIQRQSRAAYPGGVDTDKPSP